MTHGAIKLGPLASVDREPPQDIGLEQAFLGAVLVNSHTYALVADFLHPSHFCEPIHQEIFEIVARLSRDGHAATPLTVGQFLPEREIAGLTAREYLARLAAEATSVILAVDYARHIVELARFRQAILIGEDMVHAAYNRDVDNSADQLIDAAERALFELRSGSRERSVTWVAQAADDLIERATRIRMGEPDVATIRTGLVDLDDLLSGGLKRGHLVGVAGSTSMGKSLFLSSVSLKVASRGHGVLFYSLEMPRSEIMARLLTDQCYDRRNGINPIAFDRVLRPGMCDQDAEDLVLSARQFRDLPLMIDDTGSLTVAQIAARTRSEKSSWARRNLSLDLLVVDYLGLIRPTDSKVQRHIQIGEITRALKALSKDLDVCVLLAAQLNREPSKRNEHRPQLPDLRESGDVENDLDVALLLYREAYYLRADPKLGNDPELQRQFEELEHVLEINVAKNRHGDTQIIHVYCNTATGSIRNIERRRESFGGRPR
jgi:replicative DNA helicase